MHEPIHKGLQVIIEDEAMDGDITSDVVNVNNVYCYSVQAVWSDGSSPSGSLILQCSNDQVTFDDVSAHTVSGNSGSHTWNVEKAGYGFIRVFYDRTSGDATLNVNVNLKQ